MLSGQTDATIGADVGQLKVNVADQDSSHHLPGTEAAGGQSSGDQSNSAGKMFAYMSVRTGTPVGAGKVSMQGKNGRKDQMHQDIAGEGLKVVGSPVGNLAEKPTGDKNPEEWKDQMHQGIAGEGLKVVGSPVGNLAEKPTGDKNPEEWKDQMHQGIAGEGLKVVGSPVGNLAEKPTGDKNPEEHHGNLSKVLNEKSQ